MGRLAWGFTPPSVRIYTPPKIEEYATLWSGDGRQSIRMGWEVFLGTIMANFGYHSKNSKFPDIDSLQPEPENLPHADTVALKDLDDAFTQAQVDTLVKELEEWALRALNMKQLFILDSLT